MDNFYCTAHRMWKDANVLHTSGSSYFNTCYLAGYILESYGKLIVKAYDSTINVRRFSHSLSDLNTKIKNDITIAPSLGKYCLDLSIECNTIFSGNNEWGPLKRYEDNPNLWSTKQTADSYISESKKIIDMIDEMKIDGVI
ncbi:hypothetical protein [Bacillus sp. SG-1]|uniref:hypothetical protein n=1 Tax=Bacillus sp. SG-1 TaxID=161544 RepID=UPI00015440DA|nr:hypothetical protein [Bacillus sp. SG-1]EDL65726.1 hypothetical protein BSG1_12666 [Bacillus sp. SG-1]